MNDHIYEVYRKCRRLLKMAAKHDFEEEIFSDWKQAVEHLDQSSPRYKERYEREEAVVASFTQDQINHICYQIGEWYLLMKPLLEGQHNLGYMKEVLKNMICGYE